MYLLNKYPHTAQFSTRPHVAFGAQKEIESEMSAKQVVCLNPAMPEARSSGCDFVTFFLGLDCQSAADKMKPDRMSPEYMRELSTALRWDGERQELYLRLPSFPHLRLVLLRPGIEDDLVSPVTSKVK